MKMHTSRNWLSVPVVALTAFAATACGGTIDFQDKTAVAIDGEGPPAPVKKKRTKKPKKPGRVEVKADQIKINEKIMFAKGKAEILGESDDLLNEIADVLEENAQLLKIVVEGYTSAEGDAAYNKKLSQERAEAVVAYLVEAGIDGSRLEAKGYGPEKPIAPNDTEDNREKNRRVEFKIVAK